MDHRFFARPLSNKNQYLNFSLNFEIGEDKVTARKAEQIRGYGRLEKANASGNAGDRGSNFAPHQKMADF
jgi:hypothetical protein